MKISFLIKFTRRYITVNLLNLNHLSETFYMENNNFLTLSKIEFTIYNYMTEFIGVEVKN